MGLQEACGLLKGADSEGSEIWKGYMARGAPFSQAVSWHLLQLAEKDASAELPDPDRMSLALERDFATARRMLYWPDFREGVRVVLVDKGASAKWQTKNLDEIVQEDVVAATAISPGERQLGILQQP